MASPQNFPPLHLRPVCVFSALLLLLLRRWRRRWWGFLPRTHYAVVCISCLAAGSCRCLLAALLEAVDGRANWLHVFELWLTGDTNCNSESFGNYIHTRHTPGAGQALITVACSGSRMPPSCCSGAEALEDGEIMRSWTGRVPPPGALMNGDSPNLRLEKVPTRQNLAPRGNAPKHCYPCPKVSALTSASRTLPSD